MGIDWLAEQKEMSKVIHLGVYSENPRALKFYERNGFQAIGEYPFPLNAARMLLMRWEGYPVRA